MANITDFIIDEMQSPNNRDNMNIGVLAEPLYVSEKPVNRQAHDNRALKMMKNLYKEHASKGTFNPQRFTFGHWLDAMGSEMQAGNFQGQLDAAFEQDVKGTLSGDQKWKVALGDVYQNLYGQDHQLFMDSVRSGLALESQVKESDVPFRDQSYGYDPSWENTPNPPAGWRSVTRP